MMFFFSRCVEMTVKRGTIEIKNPKLSDSEAPKKFTFDSIYDWK